jgi:hypothetical protein
MYLLDCSQVLRAKVRLKPKDGRPEAPMDIGHLSPYQTADHNVF